jgi:hypothetical protein
MTRPRHSAGSDTGASGQRNRRRAWNWLLALPIIAPMLTPLVNSVDPLLWGIPLFYWYQLACAVLAIVVIATVYQLTKERHP